MPQVCFTEIVQGLVPHWASGAQRTSSVRPSTCDFHVDFSIYSDLLLYKLVFMSIFLSIVEIILSALLRGV